MPERSPEHRVYLETFKDFLKRDKHPGDMDRLRRSVVWLRGLELDLTQAEREEIRDLLVECFNVPMKDVEALVPPLLTPAAVTAVREPMPAVSGLLADYVKMTDGQESPEEFHAFALLTCMGAALGRRVWMDMTWFKVWPNLSVVLTGPAGGPKKNTAWDMALETVRACFRGWDAHQISDASPQALVEELAKAGKQAIGFIYAPEFRHFFPSQNYMEGAIPLITRLLDNPDFYPVSRITRKASTLRNVTLSMAGGSTLDWLAKLPADAQGGGFFTRVMIVHAERGKGSRPEPDRAAGEVVARVARKLHEIDQFAWGEIRMGEAAKRWYEDWYRGMKAFKTGNPRLTLYYNRKQTHLLRLAMLMALPAKELTVRGLEEAKRLLDWTEKPLPDVYRVIGMTKTGELTRALFDMLREKGGRCGYGELMRELKGQMSLRDFRMAVETLVQAGQVSEVENAIEHALVVRSVGMVE